MCPINISTGYAARQSALYMKARMSGSSGASKYFAIWENKYKNLKFSVGEKTFGSDGIGNVIIAPEKLKEIENSAQSRWEFEDVLDECDKTARSLASRGGALEAQGFLYDKKGGLTGWSMARNSSGTKLKYIVSWTKKIRRTGSTP